ncbi:hypothetical protein [Cupriavidus basilensis]|uniref:Uncharacterized protein n=1 Tax=Cupriavidus basilensis TaxID=68895 RepID=A0A0C4YPF2_9BURK|nr:hypothetical protein [Cupriavidus basilensis]AJG23929.1 hypothetical protein RR42_s2347 [Cupriavidus basilensis]
MVPLRIIQSDDAALSPAAHTALTQASNNGAGDGAARHDNAAVLPADGLETKCKGRGPQCDFR